MTFFSFLSFLQAATAPAGGWSMWRLIGAGVVVAAVAALAAAYIGEFRAVRKAGGVKEYSRDVASTNYGFVRGVWTCEVVVGVVAAAILLRAFVPSIVGELQIEAVVALFTMAGALRSIDFGKFWVKRATEDPVIAATHAAINDPTLLPVVSHNEKTGETTMTTVQAQPVQPAEQPAAEHKPVPPFTPAPVVVDVPPPPAEPPKMVRDD